MALIYRSVLEIEDHDSRFVDRARAPILEWLRWKAGLADVDPDLVELTSEEPTDLAPGMELTCADASGDGCSVLRVSLFESRRDDATEVKTTVTATSDPERSWAWVDLERWTHDQGRSSWVPSPPGIVRSVLRAETARRGAVTLTDEATILTGEEGASVAEVVVDPARDVPVVVVSYNASEEDGVAVARARGDALAKRLAGVAIVRVLGEGAVSAFSKAILDAVGQDMDVHSGAVRTYVPGAGSDADHPGRHRFVPFRKLDGRRPDLASLIVASGLFLRAVEMPPPPVWRASARALLVGRGEGRDLDELLAVAEEEIAELRSRAAELEEEREEAVDESTDLLRRNDDLARRVEYLRARLRELEPAALTSEPTHDSFDPVLSVDVLAEARRRLSMVVLPPHLDEGASSLDALGDPSWATKAWSAFQALDNYARVKGDGSFDGSFATYCERGDGDFTVPAGWVALTETKQTMAKPEFRRQRTLPIAREVDPSAEVVMEAHVKIEKGGAQAPRIHFHDDTRGPTGKIHIGWFGPHLDSWAKS